MNNPFKKLTKTMALPLLTLPLIMAANSVSAADSIEDRIKQLETMVKPGEVAKIIRKEVKRFLG